jgi:dCTP deaminase
MSERSEHSPRRSYEEMYGTLPDWAIVQAIERGSIGIDPLPQNWRQKMGTVSIDFMLGSKVQILRADKGPLDTRRKLEIGDYDEVHLDMGEPFELAPGALIIAKTMHRLTLSYDIVGYMEGISGLARFGVAPFVGAARFDPGYDNYPVCEIKGEGHVPVILYCGDRICAFRFERLMAEAERTYDMRGTYTDRDTIHSRIGEYTTNNL